MNAVFADTGFYVAMLSKRDSLHDRVLEFLTTFEGQIVTTEFILIETANFNSRPADRKRFVSLIEQIRADEKTLLVPATSDLFEGGQTLFRNRLDKEWSLTDCISFVVMSDNELSDALTADNHFEQAGFRALLKEPGDS